MLVQDSLCAEGLKLGLELLQYLFQSFCYPDCVCRAQMALLAVMGQDAGGLRGS